MLFHSQISNTLQPPNVDEVDQKRLKLYSKPCLEELGDLRALTLGGSPGSGDSGADFCEIPGSGGVGNCL